MIYLPLRTKSDKCTQEYPVFYYTTIRCQFHHFRYNTPHHKPGNLMPKPSQPLSRKDFIRLAGLSVLGLGLEPLLSACAGPEETEDTTATTLPEATPQSTATEQQSAEDTTEPTDAPADPTATNQPAILDSREQRRQALIEKFGTATKALPLEFHGDHYWFYDGAYSMDPETFVWMMEWFRDNEVWPLSASELLGFLDGNLQLPARSVILTTDSGAASMDSIDRMIPVLKDTGMHFISLIWTMQMTAEETAACPDNLCWDKFNWAMDEGVFSIGTHSEYHLPMAEKDQDFGYRDLSQSIAEIKTNMGIHPEILSWPNESCPSWQDTLLPTLGLKAAFGGRSRPLGECAVYANDPLRYCLPRLFPPNRQDRLSGRPPGMSLEEMAVLYMDGFES
jgi:hypothetical protein